MINPLHSRTPWAHGLAIATVFVVAGFASAQQRREVVLRLNSDGPRTTVSEMLFCDSDQRLLMSGWDKTVQSWRVLPSGDLALEQEATFRIPIGPSQAGVINSISVSDDNRMLAVGAVGVIKGASGFRDNGRIFPTDSGKTDSMELDEGTIQIIDRRDRSFKTLRGHGDPVNRLVFAKNNSGQTLLFSLSGRIKNGTTTYTLRRWLLSNQQFVETRFSEAAMLAVPQLTVIGDGSANPTVAITTASPVADGKLRVWDPAANRLSESVVGLFGSCIARLPVDGECVTGSGGQVKHWAIRGGAITPKQTLAFPTPHGLIWIPQAIQHVQHAGQQFLVVGAIGLARGSGVASQARLFAFRWPSNSLATIHRDIKLWDIATANPPVISFAFAKTKGLLVAAGNPNHEVSTFKIADFLGGQPNRNSLSSKIHAIESVTFAERAGTTGLLIREKGQARNNLSFDLRTESMADKAIGDWQATATRLLKAQKIGESTRRKDHVKYRVSLNDNQIEFELFKSQTLSKIAASPDGSALAVATHIFGQDPRLSIIDSASGAAIREFKAHSERIESLAFSADGKRLASAGRDRRICVWDMTTLNQIRGQHGTLANVTVDKQAVIKTVMPPRAAGLPNSVLKAGDKLIGFVGSDKTWASANAMFHAIWTRKPNASANLNVQRGADTIELPVQISQAADERKPLFSILITRDANDSLRWISWNPLGPFQTSDSDLMTKIGWHFNSGNAGRPVEFMDIGKYRNQYFRPHLVRDLYSTGQIPPRPKPAPPTLSLLLLPSDTLARQLRDSPLLRTPVQAASLSVSATYPADFVEGVRFKFDDVEVAGKMRLGNWQAAAPPEFQQPGQHTLSATLLTSNDEEREFAKKVAFEYRPPEIQVRLDEGPFNTTEASFGFKASVIPGIANQQTLAKLQFGDQQKSWDLKGPQSIELSVPLALGKNEFTFTVAAADKKLGLKTQSRSVQVFRANDRTTPPNLKLSKLRFAEDGIIREVPVHRNQPAIVGSAICLLQGSVGGTTDPVSKLQIALNGDAVNAKNAQLVGTAINIDLAERLQLNPGKNTLRVTASTARSESVSQDLAIQYHPPLPTVTLISPANGTTIDRFVEDSKINAEVLLENLAIVGNGGAIPPYSVRVVVNGMEFKTRIARPQASETRTFKIPLRFGSNEIQFFVTNEWRGDERKSDVTSFEFVPESALKLIQINPKVEDEATFDARVRLQSGFDVTAVQLDGVPVDLPKITDRQGVSSTLNLNNLGIVKGRRKARLRVLTGPVAAEVDIEIPVKPNLPAAPSINVLSDGGTVLQSSYPLRFDVDSDSQLSQLIVRLDGEVVLNDATAKFPVSLDVPLGKVGVHEISISAKNRGGMAVQQIAVNYLATPASIAIQQVTDGQNAQAVQFSDGVQRVTGDVGKNNVWVKGSVNWTDPQDTLQTRAQTLHVMVNGYQQTLVDLEPPKDKNQRRLEFTAPVTLSEPNNDITVRLMDKPVSADASTRLKIACSSPEPIRKRNLRLVMMHAGGERRDAEKLKQKVATSLGCVLNSRTRQWEHPFFNAVLFSGSQSVRSDRRVAASDISIALRMIGRKQDRASVSHPANEVVVFYYRGRVQRSGAGREYLLRSPTSKDAYSFPLDSLHADLKRIRGAKFLLTDLEDGGSLQRILKPNEESSAPSQPWAAEMGYAVRIGISSDQLISEIGVLKRDIPSKPIAVGHISSKLNELANAKGYRYRESIPFPIDALQL